ncbi:MAG: pyruvate formate lyase family protein [Armatimonadota bacterium]
MNTQTEVKEYTYQERIEALRAKKMEHTLEKQIDVGYMDFDDHGIIQPPVECREVVETTDENGTVIRHPFAANFKGLEFKTNLPGGRYYGAKLLGENYRATLEHHPVYIDPMGSLAGAYMADFNRCGMTTIPPGVDFSHLHAEQKLYKMITGIGALHHHCQDLKIGLDLGWGGILDKIRFYREKNAPKAPDFYDALENIVLGTQNWIKRHVDEGRKMAEAETRPQIKQNLIDMADINEKLINEPPATFREAVQWILWYQLISRMYNGSGSLGREDVLLQPYYDRDMAAGILTDEEAIFHLACQLIRETGYIQVGGLDENGKDVTTQLSFNILEAAHRLRIPANVSVCMGEGVDEGLAKRGVEIMFEDKAGVPRFLGIENTAKGFTKYGFPLSLARQRGNAGCHWYALPGREYALNDVVKISFGNVMDVALRDMMADKSVPPSVERLWQFFEKHLRRSIEVVAEGLDIHLEHFHEGAPELVLDLLCHGPIEKGEDMSHGGVEFCNIGVDGAALAVAADSFAAIEQRIENESRMTWDQLIEHLDSDWAGAEGERARLMMQSVPRFGSGGSRSDDWAVRISKSFSEMVAEKPTPIKKANLIPGLFSWASTISFGQALGATANGRHAGEPISHGANPLPGFRQDGAATALALSIASVQCGYGSAAPMQIEIDPSLSAEEGGVDYVYNLLKTHVELGGTQINMNIVDKEQIIEAHKDPSKFPDLTVRATGFSVFFANLSPEFRQLVVDRIISEC